MKRILFLALFLSACGSDNSSTDDKLKQNEENQGGGIERQTEEPKPNVVEYHKEGGRLALALEDTKDLPACTFENDSQLAYIKKTEQFFSCDEETWVEIPMKAKEGPSGTAGAQGPAGPPGPKGDDGAPATANQWFDPMAKKTWLVGAAVTQAAIMVGPEVCSGDYRMATSAELQTAVTHGLSIASGAFGGSTSFWSSDTVADVSGDLIPVFVNASGQANVSAGAPAGVACIEEL